jgi:hypothetical protein
MAKQETTTYRQIADSLPAGSREELERETRKFAHGIGVRGSRIRQRLAEERMASLITFYRDDLDGGAAPDFDRDADLDDIAMDFAGELTALRG